MRQPAGERARFLTSFAFSRKHLLQALAPHLHQGVVPNLLSRVQEVIPLEHLWVAAEAVF